MTKQIQVYQSNYYIIPAITNRLVLPQDVSVMRFRFSPKVK